METKLKLPNTAVAGEHPIDARDDISRIATTVRRALTKPSASVLSFSSNEIQNSPRTQTNNNPEERGWNHFVGTLAAGIGSGALSSTICAPLSLIHI